MEMFCVGLSQSPTNYFFVWGEWWVGWVGRWMFRENKAISSSNLKLMFNMSLAKMYILFCWKLVYIRYQIYLSIASRLDILSGKRWRMQYSDPNTSYWSGQYTLTGIEKIVIREGVTKK